MSLFLLTTWIVWTQTTGSLTGNAGMTSKRRKNQTRKWRLPPFHRFRRFPSRFFCWSRSLLPPVVLVLPTTSIGLLCWPRCRLTRLRKIIGPFRNNGSAMPRIKPFAFWKSICPVALPPPPKATSLLVKKKNRYCTIIRFKALLRQPFRSTPSRPPLPSVKRKPCFPVNLSLLFEIDWPFILWTERNKPSGRRFAKTATFIRSP